jgi:hypothetical protein
MSHIKVAYKDSTRAAPSKTKEVHFYLKSKKVKRDLRNKAGRERKQIFLPKQKRRLAYKADKIFFYLSKKY